MAEASLLAAVASGPWVASRRNGSPTMILATSWLRAMSASRLARLASGSAGTVASAWAMVSVGFDPGSTARILTDPPARATEMASASVKG